MDENVTQNQPVNELTPEVISELKEKFKRYPLHQLTTTDGSNYVIRGTSFDEFSQLQKSVKGNELRLALKLVQTLVVWPDLDRQDMEYNTSGEWPPGKIAAISESIQELIGFNRDNSVKKL